MHKFMYSILTLDYYFVVIDCPNCPFHFLVFRKIKTITFIYICKFLYIYEI